MTNAAGFPSWARPVPLRASGLVAASVAGACGLLLAAWWWLAMGGAGWFEALVCAGPALATAALACTSEDDRRQYIVRVLAAALMLPLLAGFVASSADGPWTAANIVTLVIWFLAYIGGLIALIAWMASATTRLDSAAGGMPGAAAAARMAEVLRELARDGKPLAVHEGQQGYWIVDCQTPGQRTHRVELRIDAQCGELRAREVVGADGATPADADEASMRGPAGASFDPTRPDASRTWNRHWQATVIEPGRLAALRFDPGSSLPLPADLTAAAADPGATVHLLAALALRAGLAWQPTLGRP